MNKKTFTVLLPFICSSFLMSQTINYNPLNDVDTLQTPGTYQFVGIPANTVIQVECYGGGGGGGAIWSGPYATAYTGGGGGGGYAKLNAYTATGGDFNVTVGAGGLKGTGIIITNSPRTGEAYDGTDGGLSAVVNSDGDTICKATGGKKSLHGNALGGSAFSPAKDHTDPGVGGSGTIGDVLLTGGTGTAGSYGGPFSGDGMGGNGGAGAGPAGGAGGVFIDDALHYGVPGNPFGGGGSGTGDYEGNGGTYKLGGDGAKGAVIIRYFSISTGSISPSAFCQGDNVSIPFTIKGIFTSGNIFTAQLSDENGSFSSPTNIGTLSATTAGTISGVIPTGLTAGTSYRIRVISTQPIVNGSDNGTDLTINPTPDAGTISGGNEVCTAATLALTSDGTTNGTWSVDNSNSSIDNSGIVTGLSTGQSVISYTVTNSCGSDLTSTIINISPVPNPGTISGLTSVCIGSSVSLASDGDTGGTWSADNTNASIDNAGVVTGTTSGSTNIDYSVTNSCGTNSASYPITINSNPIVKVGNTATICKGDSVDLSASGANYYQWDNNQGTGGHIKVAPTVTTTYTVTGTDLNGCSTDEQVTITVDSLPTPIWGNTIASICKDSVSQPFNGSLSTNATDGHWSGGLGTWNNPNDPQAATYTPSSSELGNITIQLTASNSCGDSTRTFSIEIKDCKLSINNLSNKSNIKVYPNPTNDFFTISAESLNQNFQNYQLIDITGKTILSGEISTTEIQIQVNHLQKGIYFLHLEGKQDEIFKVEVE